MSANLPNPRGQIGIYDGPPSGILFDAHKYAYHFPRIDLNITFTLQFDHLSPEPFRKAPGEEPEFRTVKVERVVGITYEKSDKNALLLEVHVLDGTYIVHYNPASRKGHLRLKTH